MRSRLCVANRGPLALAALLLSACGPATEADSPAGNAATNAQARNFAEKMAGQPAATPPAKAFEKAEKSDLLEFAYAYPSPAASVPALVARFEKDMTVSRADALKMAREDRDAAKQSGFPFHTHSLETRWTVAADTPRMLALEASTYTFTGGAHGMTGFDALLWDRERRRETSFPAMMTSPSAFAAAIRPRFCKALDKARAEKRGAPVVPGDDEFTKCIDPMKEVLVPTSSDGKLIDGIKVVVGPYSAGPYAEGSYDIDLPVDAAMRKAIKTEYQDAFAAP